MIRLLTVVFVLLVGAVLVVELTKDPKVKAQGRGQSDGQPRSRPAEEAEEGAETPAMRVLPSRSLSKGLFEKGQWRGKPVMTDLDGDGHVDIVASIRRWDRRTAGEGIHVWLGDGKGVWTPSNEGLRRDMGYGGSAVADINRDGRPDIAFSGHAGTPALFLNFLKYEDQSTFVIVGQDIDVTSICGDVALGDFDGDGKIDFATIGQFPKESGLFVFRGDGDGSFKRVANLLGRRSYGNQLHFEDMDGDGKAELIAVTDQGPRVWRFQDDKFVSCSNGLPTPKTGGVDFAILAVDLIGDKHKELVRVGINWEEHRAIQPYRWDGKEWMPFGTGLPNDESYFDISMAKLDRGGSKCMVASSNSGIHVIAMKGEGKFELVGRIENSEAAISVCAGDVDGDGIDEVLYAGFRGIRVLQATEDWFKTK